VSKETGFYERLATLTDPHAKAAVARNGITLSDYAVVR